MRKVIAITTALLLTTPIANAAMSDADCAAAFTKADVNADGTVSETEATNYFAAMRLANKPAADAKISKADFLANCKAGTYDTVTRVNDPGAPLPGANSFTEAQAQDRAVAAGYTKVSGLKKDANGVWRGTATGNGKSINVAIDFKGNVVAN